MKKFLLSSLFAAISFSICMSCFSQIIPRTAVMPDSTYSPSIQNGINAIPNSPTSPNEINTITDSQAIRIFPSAAKQSEKILFTICNEL